MYLAGLADRLGAGLPNQLDGLDSRTPLHKFAVFVQWLGRQTASLHTPVRVWYTAPRSCRQLFSDVVEEKERSSRTREVGIPSIPVGPQYSGKVELAHHDGLISRSSKVRFLVPLPFCTWGMGLLAVVASLAMRTFSGVGIPDPPPVCLDS